MTYKIYRDAKRKWPRYQMKTKAIVLLHKKRVFKLGKPKFVELGLILDISWGGLSVQCAVGEKTENKASELSILVPPEEFVLQGIPFQTVSDCRVDSANISRRCIRFGELNKDQKDRLVDFIKKHTIQTE